MFINRALSITNTELYEKEALVNALTLLGGGHMPWKANICLPNGCDKIENILNFKVELMRFKIF